MNRTTKGALAACTAGVLLIGGRGTLATWNDGETITGSAISSGELKLTEVSCAGWKMDGLDFDPVTRLVVPGDIVTRTCKYTIEAIGENLSATVGLATPSFAGGSNAALVAALDTTATYTIDDDPLAGPAAVTIANGASIGSSNDGDELTAVVSVTFNSGTAGTTAQSVTATLASLTVSLTQA